MGPLETLQVQQAPALNSEAHIAGSQIQCRSLRSAPAPLCHCSLLPAVGWQQGGLIGGTLFPMFQV